MLMMFPRARIAPRKHKFVEKPKMGRCLSLLCLVNKSEGMRIEKKNDNIVCGTIGNLVPSAGELKGEPEGAA